jgi:hypothetical protein
MRLKANASEEIFDICAPDALVSVQTVDFKWFGYEVADLHARIER